MNGVGANKSWEQMPSWLLLLLSARMEPSLIKKIPLYQHIAEVAGNPQMVLLIPAFNVMNGGSHAGNKLAMQEFIILPTGASSFKEAMKMGSEVYHHLKGKKVDLLFQFSLSRFALSPLNLLPDSSMVKTRRIIKETQLMLKMEFPIEPGIQEEI